MISAATFKMRLERYVNLNLELIINENRSTMINLLEKQRSFARLSIHKMFLGAPDPVMRAIAHYIRGTRKERAESHQILRQFIQCHLSEHDYTHLIDPKRLVQQGRVYQLQPMYAELNQKYFQNQLNLSLTWFGSDRHQRRSRLTFGQYLAGLRLIKMHRLLDNAFFPEYFVSFVLYHEMLHSVVPSSVDARGRVCFHDRSFREKERAFEHYHKAIAWEKNNKQKILV